MNQESRVCQSCKQAFIIEPEDFNFYERMKVPPPKMCPLCRAKRRLAFRNERSFYKRRCDKCQKEMVSMYSPNKPYAVWCHDCWFADDWDPRDYGREYAPGKSFFEQFEDLWNKIPKVALIHVRSINSEYLNICADNKNCYMIIESSNNEDCVHCYWIQVCKDLVDVSFSHKTELSYESDDCFNCYKLFYSKGCQDSRESYFLLDCRDCSNCIGCVNLRNKQYHIFNQPFSKDEYENFLKSARLDTYSGVEKLRKDFEKFVLTQPLRFSEAVNTVNSTGNYMKNTKNCRKCFHAYDAEDCAYSVHVWRDAKDCMDCDTSGRQSQLIYNSTNSGLVGSNYICCSLCWGNNFLTYCLYCYDSNNCFGSVGLRKQKYCILNKQYGEKEYGELKKVIIENMKKVGDYGDYYPPTLSTFGYNEACVQEQFPLTKEKALKQGFKWEDTERGTFSKETISWDKVPGSINDAGDLDVPKQVLVCLECKKNYLIIPREFDFYKNLKIPLPRLCPDCRHMRRFKARGPNRLWQRQCMCEGKKSSRGVYANTREHFHAAESCPNEFETSYSPDRKEIVYCEQCYNAEVA
ncbi:MAG: hypothetical protein Q7R86_03115 [bacterium]|nr:hypothetical protein [bacterium]